MMRATRGIGSQCGLGRRYGKRSPVRKRCGFRTVSAGRKRTVESVDYSMASVAISTHQVFRVADVHGQVMRYFPKPGF